MRDEAERQKGRNAMLLQAIRHDDDAQEKFNVMYSIDMYMFNIECDCAYYVDIYVCIWIYFMLICSQKYGMALSSYQRLRVCYCGHLIFLRHF